MKRLLAAVLLALPALSFAAGEEKPKTNDKEAAARTQTVFRGTIGDVSNYQPLSNVTLVVSAHDSDFRKVVKTDGEGKFIIENLPAGIYKVRFEKEGYEPGNYQSLVVREGSDQNFGFLLFEK